ncbi:MAG: 3-phosphoshikimate 1-carboxyvinyltransferase [Terriglobia bacterium]|jgi:3-phosphoshikimate 1-carboxyvinyltransferase|nr:3-phosphoshikimate 1-carboxyvinyltransferase [Terriglobia bacterium]
MSSGNNRVIHPAQNVNGSVRLPGDKSISHRYAMLGALAEGVTKLENFSAAADCQSTLNCLAGVGVKVQQDGRVEIEGRGRELSAPTSAVDCGNSGSTMRMLAGILAGQNFESELVGDESLMKRPMGRIIEPLRAMGAQISGTVENKPPLHIRGGSLKALEYNSKIASAQVKTCVLFAGLFAEGKTSVEEPVRTRDHGELALRAFGAEVERTQTRVSVAGRGPLKAIEAYVPGDLSSAAFFLCAAALFPESNLILDHVLLNPTRAGILDVLTLMGGRISFLQVEQQHYELIGTVRFQPGKLKGARISGAQVAGLIDELPVLAAIGPYTEDGVEIRDARELRVKESDRVAAVVQNLRAMGATVEEFEDGLRVPGGQTLHGAELESFGDHRIAMAFSVAALRADGDTVINDANCVAISYPMFYEQLEKLIAG